MRSASASGTKPRMAPLPSDRLGAADERLLGRIVTAAFGQRRKTLRNTLRDFLDEADFAALGIDAGLRGETLSLSVAAGSRTQFYQVAFTEPYLFDRPITAGVDVSRRAIQYIGAFTQQTTGVNTVWGFPLTRNFTRGFLQYSYEQVMITDLNPAYTDPDVIGRNPFLQDALLLPKPGA